MSAEVKPGYKMTEVGVIPEGWSVQPLAQLVSGVEYGSSAKSASSGDVPVLRMGNLQGGKIDWSDLVFTSDPQEIERYTLKTGDVLFNRTNTVELVGKTAIYEGNAPAIFAGYLIRIKEKKDLLDSRYLNYILNSESSKKYGSKVVSIAVGQANINGQKLKTYPIPLPSSLDEQKRIADAISEMEDFIVSVEQLIAKKRNIKQAAMQQLLTGQKRLPGFSGEWEARELGDVIKEISDGGTPPTADSSNFGGKIYWVVIEDIQSEIKNTRSTLTIKGLQKCASRLWPVGTLILSTGATIGEVGVLQVEAATKQGICGIIFDEKIAETTFMKYWFSQHKSLLLSKAQGSSIKEVRAPTLVKLCARLPDVDEQAAIASLLSDIDAELATLEARRDKARQLKQGMMQEILTGRIRLV